MISSLSKKKKKEKAKTAIVQMQPQGHIIDRFQIYKYNQRGWSQYVISDIRGDSVHCLHICNNSDKMKSSDNFSWLKYCKINTNNISSSKVYELLWTSTVLFEPPCHTNDLLNTEKDNRVNQNTYRCVDKHKPAHASDAKTEVVQIKRYESRPNSSWRMTKNNKMLISQRYPENEEV